MRNTNTVVAGIVAVVITTLICATLVMLFAPHADIGPLLAVLAPTVASLGALAQVAQVKKHTEALTNGLADAKGRAAIADVLPTEQLDPSYVAGQMEADRHRRAQGV